MIPIKTKEVFDDNKNINQFSSSWAVLIKIMQQEYNQTCTAS